jgi:adenosine deaminase
VERRIGLEVCPTSNVLLGVYPSLADHPLPELVARGALVSVSTDTPAMFDISLTDELSLLETHFQLAPAAIDRIVLNAFEMSFLPEDEKAALVASARDELAALRTADAAELLT